MEDREVESLLEEAAMARYVASSRRPPLDACSEAEFEADLVLFLEARNERSLASLVRERRITWCAPGRAAAPSVVLCFVHRCPSLPASLLPFVGLTVMLGQA